MGASHASMHRVPAAFLLASSEHSPGREAKPHAPPRLQRPPPHKKVLWLMLQLAGKRSWREHLVIFKFYWPRLFITCMGWVANDFAVSLKGQ